jgi:hypothetical protein
MKKMKITGYVSVVKKTRKKGTGWSNLMHHIKSQHPEYNKQKEQAQQSFSNFYRYLYRYTIYVWSMLRSVTTMLIKLGLVLRLLGLLT